MSNVYAGWKRLWAFLIDSIILMSVGYVLFQNFYNQLFSLGNWSLTIGFVIFILYYGLLNSSLCKGQTIGKLILKIKVVSANGEYLTPVQSMLRSLILTPVLVFNGISLPFGYISMIWSAIVTLMLFLQVILFFVNKPSRQLLHDLIMNTACIKVNEEVQSVERNKVKLAWAIGIPLLLTITVFIFSWHFLAKLSGMDMQKVTNMQKAIKKHTNTNLVGFQVSKSKNFTTNEETSSIVYIVSVPKINIYNEKQLQDKAAQVVLTIKEYDDKLIDYDKIWISIDQYVNIGIIRANQGYSQSGDLLQWLNYIKENNIK